MNELSEMKILNEEDLDLIKNNVVEEWELFASKYGPKFSHDPSHLSRVETLCLKIVSSDRLNCNESLLRAAAWLHDLNEKDSIGLIKRDGTEKLGYQAWKEIFGS